MTSEKEIRVELQRLFPGENVTDKVNKILTLINDGLSAGANNQLKRWRIKSEQLAMEQNNDLVEDYRVLGGSPAPLGIRVRGFEDIGYVILGVGRGKLSLQANESVDVDKNLSGYFLRVTLNDVSSAIVQYHEINNFISVIDKIQAANSCITKFKSFQAKWTNSDGLSLCVSNDDTGFINSSIAVGSVTLWPENLQKLDEIKVLLERSKDYIDENLQQVGYIDFKIIEKERRFQEEFSEKLPGIIAETTLCYIKQLARKFHQLTYWDEYDTREYGGFFSEVDRFIGKKLSGLTDDQHVFARNTISEMVESYALDPANNITNFNSTMDPLDYERYCASFFSRSGWISNMTPKAGDQGADIIIKYNNISAVVQCKLYNQPVGNGAVQEVIAAREYYQAPIALVVSNANFTTSARQLAASANVVLLHHDDIETYSASLGVEPVAAPIDASV